MASQYSDTFKCTLIDRVYLLYLSLSYLQSYPSRKNSVVYCCRYGGFSLGNTRPFVPEDFGKNAPSEFRRLAVRHVAKVRHWNSFLDITELV